jgi:hypothetical protein
MRIVELPFQFCTGQHLPLAVLIHRTDKLTVSHEIHLGESYDFSGAVVPATYQFLQGHNRYAQHGIVAIDYPTDTLTIDRETGLVVTLDGIDTTLDEQSAFNALSDELLVFVGDEILSVIAVDLVGVNTYRLQVIRERMATPRQEHLFGAEVYLIAQRDLAALTHRSFVVENEVSLKVVNATGSFSQDLSEVDAVTHTVEGRVFSQTAPKNLRVNGHLRNATYTGGADLRLDWSLHELRASIAAMFGIKARTLIEIISLVDDSVLYSKLTYGEMFKILAARMATILGAETSFVVRISTHILGSNLQLQSATIQLTVLPP